MLPWKILFLFILFLGSMLAVSASSWLSAWMGLEMNLLALLGLLMSDKSTRNSEASLKYFLIQALASAVLISSAFSSSAMFSFLSSLTFFSNFIILSLILKVGGAPFHGWVPQIIEGLTWSNNAIVLTWQKVAPFVLIASCLETKYSFSIVKSSIILSSIVGSLMGLTQSSIRKLIAYSSINHIGWMLAGLMIKISAWMVYMSTYSAMLIFLIKMISSMNFNSLSSMSFSLQSKNQIPFFVSLLSFGGLPPFLGFAPKWLIISLLSGQSFSIAMILIMSSLITLYFYTRMSFSTLLMKTLFMQKYEAPNPIKTTSLIINLTGLAIVPAIFLL